MVFINVVFDLGSGIQYLRCFGGNGLMMELNISLQRVEAIVKYIIDSSTAIDKTA